MKKFKVYVTWTALAYHIVKAETEKKAMKKAQNLALPDPKNEYGNDNYMVTDAEEISVTETKFRKIP